MLIKHFFLKSRDGLIHLFVGQQRFSLIDRILDSPGQELGVDIHALNHQVGADAQPDSVTGLVSDTLQFRAAVATGATATGQQQDHTQPHDPKNAENIFFHYLMSSHI